MKININKQNNINIKLIFIKVIFIHKIININNK